MRASGFSAPLEYAQAQTALLALYARLGDWEVALVDGESHAAARQGKPYNDLPPGILADRTIHEIFAPPMDMRRLGGMLAPLPHHETCCCVMCHPDWDRIPDEAWARHLAARPEMRHLAEAAAREREMQDWSV